MISSGASSDASPGMAVRPEIELLLTLARPSLSPSEAGSCRRLVQEQRESFDWGYFVDQAGRHKVLPLVGHHIARHRLHDGGSGAPLIPYFDLYAWCYLGNRMRNEVLGREFGSLLRGLGDAGLPYAVRKGPVICDALYGDIGLRRMNDLDVLIHREHLEAVGQVLERSGFRQGRLSTDGSTVEPYDRATQVFWRMNVNNALPYIKAGGHIAADVVAIDLCLDLFQPRSEGAIPVPTVLGRRVPVQLFGQPSFALSPADQFLDLCLHFYKEATARYYIQAGVDLQLQKFLDVALACDQASKQGRWAEIRELVAEAGAGRSVYFAMQYAATLYPEYVPQQALSAFRPDDGDLLEEYGELDGRAGRWSAPLLERLFDPNRSQGIEGTSGVPHA